MESTWDDFLALDSDDQVRAVITTMTAIVDEAGHDFVYRATPETQNRCVYVRDERPDCLIGRVLHRLGLPVDALRRMDTACTGGLAINQAVAKDYLPESMSLIALEVMSTAQGKQDNGAPWGTVLATAIRRAQSYGVTLTLTTT